MSRAQEQPVWFTTGCSSGFGRELCRTVISHGHHLIASSRSPDKTPDLVDEITSQGGHWLALDTTSQEAEVQITLTKAHEMYGRVDYLVNNAGTGPTAGFEDFAETDVKAVFETDVFGAFRVTKAVLPFMRERKRGCVVNVSSRSGIEGLAGFSVYASSKSALEGVTEGLVKEYEGFGVRFFVD